MKMMMMVDCGSCDYDENQVVDVRDESDDYKDHRNGVDRHSDNDDK